MKFKCISLWQPWASAMAYGSKRVETRSWPTDYRGPLAIHAAKRCVKDELIFLNSHWNWQGALHPSGCNWGGKPLWELLPFGAIVGVCDLIDCRPTNSFTVGELETHRLPDMEYADLYKWTEKQMGNFEPGRFGWVLDNIRLLPEPVPTRGQQGFWTVDLDVPGFQSKIDNTMQLPGLSFAAALP